MQATANETIRAGATGEGLVKLLRAALADYRAAVELPTAEQAAGWVLTRTSCRRGPHDGRWTLATVAAVAEATRGYAAYADGRRCFRYARNYHPCLIDIREVCRTIRGL